VRAGAFFVLFTVLCMFVYLMPTGETLTQPALHGLTFEELLNAENESNAVQGESEVDIQTYGELEPKIASQLDLGLDQPETLLIKGELSKNDTVSRAIRRALNKESMDDAIASTVVKKLSRIVDFKTSMPGDSFSILTDGNGQLLRCTYEKGPFDVYALEFPDGCQGEERIYKDFVAVERHVMKLSGRIDSSLFEAFANSGEGTKLALAFADVFSAQVDFNTELSEGDRFDIVYEKYFKDTEFIGYGRILAARLSGIQKDLTAFFFKDQQAEGRYFDHVGRSISASWLRSPLPVFKVSSKFSYARLHPVFGVKRPHEGVDLSAPVGTPVMAVSDGKVSFAGWKNGYGRTVVIDHAGNIQTQYAHLSRFGADIHPGKMVGQKQVIGYVGASGIATGPHLDYRVAKNGRFINPFGVKYAPPIVLAGANLKKFNAERVSLDTMLNDTANERVFFVETKLLNGPPEGWMG